MDLDTLLYDTAPVADPAPRTLAAGRVALDAATLAGARRVAAVGRVRRSRRRLGLTAVVAAAASVALVVGPTVDLGGRRPAASADAAQVMLRAGAAAGAQPGGWPDAAYWHSVSTHRQGSGEAFRREIWIGRAEIGVLKDDGVADGVIPLEVALFSVGVRALGWDELYALPTESQALERTLRDGIDANRRPGKVTDADATLFTIVGDLLRESPAAPALRKALWEVAARIPGVTLAGAVTDGAGRPGVAVERGYQRYVLDPDDGRLLEESYGGGSGWQATYLEQGPADSAPAPTNTGPTKG